MPSLGMWEQALLQVAGRLVGCVQVYVQRSSV